MAKPELPTLRQPRLSLLDTIPEAFSVSHLSSILDSDGPNDLHCYITLNSSNWRDLPFSFLAYDPLDLNDRAAMPAIDAAF